MMPSNCPRCDAPRLEKVAESPIKGKWEAYHCQECNYIWRSTEDLSHIVKQWPKWKEMAVHFW